MPTKRLHDLPATYKEGIQYLFGLTASALAENRIDFDRIASELQDEFERRVDMHFPGREMHTRDLPRHWYMLLRICTDRLEASNHKLAGMFGQTPDVTDVL